MNNSPAERRERIARIIWHRFANGRVETWEDETHRAEFLMCADAILSSDLVGTKSEVTPLAKRDRA